MIISARIMWPVFMVWLAGFFIPLIIVFYTPFGLKGKKILNRSFAMKCVSITLFTVVVVLILSGVLQLFGIYYNFFGKATTYWHALIGYLFILAALDHLVIHVKDIYRYLKKRKPHSDLNLPTNHQP